MNTREQGANAHDETGVTTPRGHDAVYPQVFSSPGRSRVATEVYLADEPAMKLAAFFDAKGVAALKEEDRRAQWHEDWIAYQREHRLYAALLVPRQYSTLGGRFDLPRLARFFEVFGYFSPGHGYSVQVSFLGLVAILMGTNDALKREAVAALEAGELLGFAVSEREHGADLLNNEFTLREVAPGRFVAGGSKYYVGNCNCAAYITTLARRERHRAGERAGRRSPMLLFALGAPQPTEVRKVRKIHTLGVRAAFVGELEVADREVCAADVIAEGRDAWDAFFGAVTLGKFLLGFASIGICEHAFHEAVDHLARRVLYGKPVIDMPHIRLLLAHAYARLTAMKLYAFRALDYVQAADAADRRYLLFNAVQKAKVSTEAVKVVALLSECIGAKAFEADTYFEMALRDVQLIPNLEGSTHINLALAAQFIPKYFDRAGAAPPAPESLLARGGGGGGEENEYLLRATHGTVHTIEFAHYLGAYMPLRALPGARRVARQARAFRIFTRDQPCPAAEDAAVSVARGRAITTIAYAQLVAENAARLDLPASIVSLIFDLLAGDLDTALAAACDPSPAHGAGRHLADCAFVADRVAAEARGRMPPPPI